MLLCFKHNNNIEFSNDSGFDCDYVGPPDYVQKQIVSELKIYPNPTEDRILNIESSKTINSIAVYDLRGVKMYQVFPKSALFQR
jgi:hypothetical protein